MMSANLLAVGLPLLICSLLGMALDRVLLGGPSCGWIERFGRGLMLGLGTAGSLSMLLDSMGVLITPASLGTLIGVLGVLLILGARRACPRQPVPEISKLSRLPNKHIALTVLLILFAVVGLAVAVRSGYLRQSFQFDAVTRWIFKAKVLHIDGTLLGRISTDPDFGFTHQRYPPLVSHIANFPALVNGHFNDRLATAIFPWFAVSLVAMVYGALARRVGPLTAALGAAWIANLPLISYTMAPPPGSGAFAGMADIPLAMFITAMGLAAIDGIEGRRDRAHLEAALALAFATLTKNEALPLILVVGLALALSVSRGRLRRALGVTGFAAAAYFILWGHIAAGLPATDENYLAQLNLDALMAGLDRIQVVAMRLKVELLSLRAWNITWPALLVLLIVGRGVIKRPVLRFLAIVVLLQFASYAFAYLVTAWTSPAALEMAKRPKLVQGLPDMSGDQHVIWFLMRLTMSRLLLHIAPLAICMGLLASPLVALVTSPREGERSGVTPRSG
ncbi:MAG: hypothetical protein ACI9EF_000026 [Pseudohongiellaceae bacterium]|jgi:hypothetical protein